MRVLLLGNSQDTGEWFEGGRKRHEIVGDLLGQAFAEPVEVIPKSIWPDAGLADVVDRWVVKHQPDVVYMTIAAFWFQYPSVPLRVRRLLGPFGSWVSDKGFRVAESPRWAYNPVFRGARGLLQMTIGGDTHFTPEEVADRITDVIRVLLSHEGIIIAVRGPDGRTNYAHSRRGAAKNERRRLKVDAALQRFCTERHVTYDQTATPLWASDIDLGGNRVGE